MPIAMIDAWLTSGDPPFHSYKLYEVRQDANIIHLHPHKEQCHDSVINYHRRCSCACSLQCEDLLGFDSTMRVIVAHHDGAINRICDRPPLHPDTHNCPMAQPTWTSTVRSVDSKCRPFVDLDD